MEQCEVCLYHVYDEEYNETLCQMALDEDEIARVSMYQTYQCPYFRFGDEYTIVRKQN